MNVTVRDRGRTLQRREKVTAATLSSFALTGAWQHLDVVECPLANVDFSGMGFHNVHFVNCDLQGADFTASALANSSFVGCDMRAAVFAGSEAQAVEWSASNLTNCTLVKAVLVNCKLQSVPMASSLACSASMTACTLEGIQADLADFSGSSWRESQLRQCSLARVTLAQALFDNLKIVQSGFSFAELDDLRCWATTFEECDLSGTNIDRVDVLGSTFHDCKFYWAECAGLRDASACHFSEPAKVGFAPSFARTPAVVAKPLSRLKASAATLADWNARIASVRLRS